MYDDDFNGDDKGDHEYDDYDEVMVIWMISAMMMYILWGHSCKIGNASDLTG